MDNWSKYTRRWVYRVTSCNTVFVSLRRLPRPPVWCFCFCRAPQELRSHRKVLRVLSTVARCRYSGWLLSDSDSWCTSSPLFPYVVVVLRTDPRERRSRHARMVWARSCCRRWKFSLQKEWKRAGTVRERRQVWTGSLKGCRTKVHKKNFQVFLLNSHLNKLQWFEFFRFCFTVIFKRCVDAYSGFHLIIIKSLHWS